ncbi:MAG TPA: tyrosine-type recombinase/integrase [Gaiellaceae bacterium]|jgi:integrase|nr:tyrosine-type recombinase/integrase [Gaiellaceae bacterium]
MEHFLRGGLVSEPPKTARSRRTIALPSYLKPRPATQATDQTARREAREEQWHHFDLIIDRGDGQPLNPNTLTAGWSRFLRSRKLPHLRFHDLRHSHATLMLLAGVHPKIVSERLGHA